MKKVLFIYIVFLFFPAFVISQGKVGINTTSPSAMLHVKDSSIVFTGLYPLPAAPSNPPVSGQGSRLMWYTDKAALRAGSVSGNHWDKTNIGNRSTALGYNTKASGEFSVAMGYGTVASGSSSTAIGHNNGALGYNSVAINESTLAIGTSSFALGFATTANGDRSVASGYGTEANGFYSFTMGRFSVANSAMTLAIGQYNSTLNMSNDEGWTSTDPAFVIGDGTSNGNRSNAFTVLKNGNTGINVDAPQFPLVFPSSLGDKISLFGQSGNHHGFGIQNALFQIHTATSGDDIAFGYGSSSAFTETMRIKNNGRVGIGVTSPSRDLHVAGTGYFTDSLGIGALPAQKLHVAGNGYISGNVGLGITNPIQKLHVQGNGYFTGNMGLGVANPLQKLHVEGICYIAESVGIGIPVPSHSLHVIGNGLFTGNVIASCGILVCSDIRYKKNISPLTNSLSSVLSLNGIYYDWDQEKFSDKAFNDKRQIGFSAQELEKVYPEMVHTDADGYKSVDYSRLTPVLVEAIKEQQKQIDFLMKEIKEIKEAVK